MAINLHIYFELKEREAILQEMLLFSERYLSVEETPPEALLLTDQNKVVSEAMWHHIRGEWQTNLNQVRHEILSWEGGDSNGT